jgi:hypothetical protein
MGGAAAAFAVLALAALSWGTLCLGEDGHVAFEVFVAGRCLDNGGTTPPAEHPVHLTACEQETGCGPCTDLRGTADAWLARTSSDVPDAGLALMSVIHAAIPQPAPATASSRLESVAARARRVATATTVLRC